MIKAKIETGKNRDISYESVDDRNVFALIAMVRNGINFSIFYAFVQKTPFSLSDWSVFLNMSERTMQRYKRARNSFDPIYSQKILEVTLLYNHGVGVFGDKNKFDTWLETINIALGGVKPRDLLDNTFGIGLLKDELTRIEHGVLS